MEGQEDVVSGRVEEGVRVGGRERWRSVLRGKGQEDVVSRRVKWGECGGWEGGRGEACESEKEEMKMEQCVRREQEVEECGRRDNSRRWSTYVRMCMKKVRCWRSGRKDVRSV